MKLTTVKYEADVKIRGVRVHFENEDGALRRVILITDAGEMYVVKSDWSGDIETIKVMKREAEWGGPVPNEAPTAETADVPHS